MNDSSELNPNHIGVALEPVYDGESYEGPPPVVLVVRELIGLFSA